MWWTLPLVLLLSPAWRTLELGQVNLLLLALVVLDAFVVPPRHRGWLTGVAAGIKLVPAVFVLFFWVTAQRYAAARLVLGFLGTAVLGLVACLRSRCATGSS
jgi:alpha-1,2-mannosyltransferase